VKLSELNELPPVISVEEAGEVLGIGRSAAYAAAARGDLPTIPLGTRRRLVPTAKLFELLGVTTGDPPERETTAAVNGGRPSREERVPLERPR
jgi:excisionase family DNA binding protein